MCWGFFNVLNFWQEVVVGVSWEYSSLNSPFNQVIRVEVFILLFLEFAR